MADEDDLLSIGAVAERTGVAISAIRFYEEQGLINSTRASSGHRRFRRATIRRISFIKACQGLGYSLEEIGAHLQALPDQRTPTRDDWERLSSGFMSDLERRIAQLEKLRDKLTGCIGCGCLSLEACHLYNPGDEASTRGPGAHFLA